MMYDLTKFQYDLLAVLAHEDDGEEYGLGIKRQLSDRYDQEINHGRLYPNLDQLIEAGLVEKGQIDKRTNSYEITDEGREVLQARSDWLDV